MKPLPAVTLAVPLFNAEAFVAATLRSLLNQTYPDFELLVFDNASTDRSAAIAGSFADPRLRLLQCPRTMSAEANWNRGLEEARGRHFKLVCADDLLEPDCLERQVAVLEAPGNEGIGVVCCARNIIDSRGIRLMKRRYPGRGGRIRGADAMRRIVRRGTNLLGEPAAVLFRADLARQIGPFRALNPYAIDVDYWMRLLAVSDLFVLEEALASFRISPTSWSSRIGLGQYRDFRRFVKLSAREHPGMIRRRDLAMSPFTSGLQFAARLLAFKWLGRTPPS